MQELTAACAKNPITRTAHRTSGGGTVGVLHRGLGTSPGLD